MDGSEAPSELIRTRVLDFVHLKFNLEAGSLIPLALRYIHYMLLKNDKHWVERIFFNGF